MKLEKKQLITLYSNLVRSLKFDDAIIKGLSEGRVLSFFHSGRGHEAVGVGACTFLKEDDYIYYHHRGHGLPYVIGKGGSPKAILHEHLGKVTGGSKGIGGFHVAFPELGIFGVGGTIGSSFPVSVGWALAAKKRGKGQVVLSFFGDGAFNRGTCHEAMNLSAVWSLPIIWVCENNLIAQFVPIKDACPLENIADAASAYCMPGVVVDGMDVLAVHAVIQEYVAKARAGEGPSLIECKCYRYRPHSEGREDRSHADLRPKEELEAWMARDPVKLFREKLITERVLTHEDVERIDQEAAAEVEEAERLGAESPPPDPSDLDRALYAD
jgi:pyruvate dehydrogenase E1 component alpha subunit